MRAALVVLLALLAGCSSTRVEVNSGTGTRSSAAGGVSVQATNGAALAIVIISLIGAAASEADRPLPHPGALIPGNSEPVPPLDPARRIHEQDCTKPVDWTSGNLRCK